jgi:hypothetical protein
MRPGGLKAEACNDVAGGGLESQPHHRHPLGYLSSPNWGIHMGESENRGVTMPSIHDTSFVIRRMDEFERPELDQPQFPGALDSFRAPVHVQFSVDVLDVGANRANRDVKLLGDFGAAQAALQQA